MNPNQANTDRNHPNDWQYALCRGVAYWALVFRGQEAIFKQELGALYVAYLLLNPPSEPIHAVALALKARERAGRVAEPDEVSQERGMGLEDAAAVRALWRRQRALDLAREATRVAAEVGRDKCACGRTGVLIQPGPRLDRRYRVQEMMFYDAQVAEALAQTRAAGHRFHLEASERQLRVDIELSERLFAGAISPPHDPRRDIESELLARLGVEAKVYWMEPGPQPKPPAKP